VNFDASGSTDPNIPGSLNDSLSYSWDFDASDGISADATGVTASHAYATVGTYNATLTVTDSFNRTSTALATITVTTAPPPAPSGGGGGGGGGRVGDTYILVLTADDPVDSLWLKSSDTVKFRYKDTDYSFLFRYVYSDKAKMGVSTASSYKEYTLDENKKYNLNLDESEESDISILPGNLHLGAGNFTFELLNIPEKKPLFVLPFTEVGKKTVTPDSTDESADLASGPEEQAPKSEDVFSEGVLEFIESLSVRKSAPLWAGLSLALVIVLVGLGLYYLVTRKEE
jgi:PKD repeat protein